MQNGPNKRSGEGSPPGSAGAGPPQAAAAESKSGSVVVAGAPPGETHTEAGRSPAPVRWGYVAAITLPLIVLNTGWIANSEMKAGMTEITISTLFIGVTFILFVLTLLNLLVRRLAGPQAGLTQPELMALYSLLSLSSVVAGVGHFGFITPFLVNAFHFAAPSNGWQAFWYSAPVLHRPARSPYPQRLL